jgi:hypothetical protein
MTVVTQQKRTTTALTRRNKTERGQACVVIAVAHRGTRIGGGERDCGLGAGQSCAPRRPGLP